MGVTVWSPDSVVQVLELWVHGLSMRDYGSGVPRSQETPPS